MKLPHISQIAALIAFVALDLAASPANAQIIVSGTLGTLTVRADGYNGPLDMASIAGGSFSGTFSPDGLLPSISLDPAGAPSQTHFTSFSLNVFDAAGNLAITYSNQNPNDVCFVSDFEYNGEELNTLDFNEFTPGDNPELISSLALTFAPGFTGTGTTPDPSLFNGYNGFDASNGADLTTGFDKISVISATAITVPEPSTTGLTILAAILAGCVIRYRRWA